MDKNVSEIYVFIFTGLLLFGILTSFIVIFIVTYYKKQQQHLREKHLLQAKFNEELLSSKIEIQEKAFEEISRELHDNVGQQLSAAAIYLNLVSMDPRNAHNEKLDTCREIISNSLQDLRHISQTLLGEKVTTAGIIASVQLEISKINKLAICKATLETDDSIIQLDPQKEIILFRIIQEAISNATKHAPGCNINIQTKLEADQFNIKIADNGNGFAIHTANTGIGLLNMRSRAQTIGAGFNLTSEPGRGTLIEINLPVK
ncbi:MAG: sensor histidine kinase [Niabella sp.]